MHRVITRGSHHAQTQTVPLFKQDMRCSFARNPWGALICVVTCLAQAPLLQLECGVHPGSFVVGAGLSKGRLLGAAWRPVGAARAAEFLSPSNRCLPLF
jgi:hypothetical protein